MRQQSKPFIVERKPTRKPKPDSQKPSIWGGLDTDIAIGLRVLQERDQRNEKPQTGQKRAAGIKPRPVNCEGKSLQRGTVDATALGGNPSCASTQGMMPEF